MNNILTENISKVKELCTFYNVRALFAIGSVCTDEFADSSDIDLLVSFFPMDHVAYADTYFKLADKLEEIFKSPVDLVTDKSVSNPFFINSVDQSKTLIYGE